MLLDEKQVISKILDRELKKLKTKNPLFSLRSLAKKLGMSSSALSEIMRGKRTISEKKALSIGSKLRLKTSELTELRSAFSKKGLEDLKRRPNRRVEKILESSAFDLMSDWRYFSLLALTRTENFESDPEWIAKRLGLSSNEVDELVARLIQLEIIRKDGTGKISDNNVCYRTPEDFPVELIRKRQTEGLTSATQSIESGNPLQFGAFATITTDVSKIEKAKVIIEDFLKQLALFLSDSDKRSEVFELQIQLFPRTANKATKDTQRV
jgi:uncharacterized protein (TIGR02147 family)